MELSDAQKEKMWQEIITQIQSEYHPLEYEKTVEQFAQEAGITMDAARHRLDKLVKQGKLVIRKIQRGKARINLYSPVE